MEQLELFGVPIEARDDVSRDTIYFLPRRFVYVSRLNDPMTWDPMPCVICGLAVEEEP